MQKETFGFKGPGSLHEDPSQMDNHERHQHVCALESRVNEKEKEISERHGISDPKGICQKIFNEKRISGHITSGSLLEALIDYANLQITFYEAQTTPQDSYSARYRDLKYFWETVKSVIEEKLHQDSKKF